MKVRIQRSGMRGDSLTDQAVRRSGTTLLGDPNHWMVRAMGGGRTRSGVAVNQHNAMTLPAAYAAIRIIANSMAQVPLNLMRRTVVNGRPQTLPAVDHPLYDMVGSRPNERTTSHRWRQTVFGHAAGWGNGYTEIERNGRGEALGLWQLLPDRTAPELREGRLRIVTNIDGQQINLPGDDVLQFSAMGWDGYAGYSPIALARQAIGLGLATEAFGASFFANDAKSGGVLIHPGKLSGGAQDRIRDDMQGQGGLENAHRIKVLEEGMKFIPTTIPPNDAQFLATQEFTVAQVARMFGVPLFLLHSHEKTTSWGSGIEQQVIAFITFTLTEWAVGAEQEMNAKLLTDKERAAGYFFKFNLNALLRGDSAARAAFYKSLIDSGVMKPDEAREKEDLNPLGGDADKTRIPAGVRLEGEPPQGAAAPSAPKPGTPTDSGEHDDE